MISIGKTLAIIGGGASGLCAAVAAGRLGARAVVLEAGARVGRKLLATGNGRCNLTNLHAAPDRYHGEAAFLAAVLAAWPPERVRSFFASLGLLTVVEGEGRVYPHSGLASSVLDVLRGALAQARAEVRTGSRVTGIRREGAGFLVDVQGAPSLRADAVLIATGGSASPKLGANDSGYALARALGHSVTPVYPGLSPLTADFPGLPALKGIRARAALQLLVESRPVQAEDGEMLFTEYGLSGVCAMQLARHVSLALARGERALVQVNLLPGLDAGALLAERREALSALPISDFFIGLFHRRLGEMLLRLLPRARLAEPIGTLLKEELDMLRRQATALPMPITGTRGLDQAQITVGGVDTAEVCPQTMESRRCPALYLAGELLNVDGDCGGMNLHLAWATGLLAAQAACGRELPC